MKDGRAVVEPVHAKDPALGHTTNVAVVVALQRGDGHGVGMVRSCLHEWSPRHQIHWRKAVVYGYEIGYRDPDLMRRFKERRPARNHFSIHQYVRSRLARS